MHWVFLGLNSGIAKQILSIYGNTKTFQYLSIFIKIYICNTCEYLHFYRKFAEMDKEKRKPKRQPEFKSFTDNKSYKNIFKCKIMWYSTTYQMFYIICQLIH